MFSVEPESLMNQWVDTLNVALSDLTLTTSDSSVVELVSNVVDTHTTYNNSTTNVSGKFGEVEYHPVGVGTAQISLQSKVNPDVKLVVNITVTPPEPPTSIQVDSRFGTPSVTAGTSNNTVMFSVQTNQPISNWVAKSSNEAVISNTAVKSMGSLQTVTFDAVAAGTATISFYSTDFPEVVGKAVITVTAPVTDAKPTDANTIAEITAWLDAQGIDHTGKTLKADLLALVPAD